MIKASVHEVVFEIINFTLRISESRKFNNHPPVFKSILPFLRIFAGKKKTFALPSVYEQDGDKWTAKV